MGLMEVFCFYGSDYGPIVGMTHLNCSIALYGNVDCAFGQRNRSILGSSGDVGRCERNEEEEDDSNNDETYRGNTCHHHS